MEISGKLKGAKWFAIPGLLAVELPTGFTIGLYGGMTTARGGAKMFAKWGGDIQGRKKEEEGLSSTNVEVSSNHDVREKSKGEGSKTASERLNSDLFLGKIK